MRDRRWLTALNFHLAGAAVLAALVLTLGVKVALAFHATRALESASFQAQQIRYAQLQAQMAHLEGLPEKVNKSHDDAAHFYETRIASNYSTIARELGQAAVKHQVRLSNTQYTPSAAIDGLTGVRIDASLSGDYIPMMHFINDIERDKDHVFFIIDGLTFTGQQGGLVNLRLRLSTYLQSGAADLPPTPENQVPAQAQAVVMPTAQRGATDGD